MEWLSPQLKKYNPGGLPIKSLPARIPTHERERFPEVKPNNKNHRQVAAALSRVNQRTQHKVQKKFGARSKWQELLGQHPLQKTKTSNRILHHWQIQTLMYVILLYCYVCIILIGFSLQHLVQEEWNQCRRCYRTEDRNSSQLNHG